MRDLANQNFSSKNSKKTRSSGLIKVILVLVLGIGVIYFLKTKLLNSETSGSSASVELKEAPRGLKPVAVDSKDIVSKGVDLKSESASFTLVKDGFSGKVSASRSYAGGIYILNVDATLEDPEGHRYAVWATNGDEELLIDYMAGTKNSFNLRVRRNDDKFMKYDGLLITLERSQLDNESETQIFKGSF